MAPTGPVRSGVEQSTMMTAVPVRRSVDTVEENSGAKGMISGLSNGPAEWSVASLPSARTSRAAATC